MTKPLSIEEVFQVQKTPSTWDKMKGLVGGGAPKAPAGGELSVSDVYGPDALAVESKEFYGPGQQAKQVVKDVSTNALKLGAATGDLLLGAPAALAGKVLNVGTRIRAMIAGESRRVQGQAGAEAETIIPEALKQPLQSLMQYYTGAKPWDQSVVEHTLEKIGVGTENLTKGVLNKEDTLFLIGTLMDTAGVKGLQLTGRAAAAKVVDRAVPPPKAETQVQVDERLAERQAVDILEQGRGRARAEQAGKPKLGSIPEPRVIETPAQVRQIFKDAKSNRVSPREAADAADVQWVKDLFEQAKRQPERPAPGEIGGEAGLVPKTRLPDAHVIGELPPTPLPESLQTAMQKVSSGQRFLLSAEERIALQGLAQESRLVNAEGKPIHSKQGGAADVKMLAALGLIAATPFVTNYILNDPAIMKAINGYANKVRRAFNLPIPADKDDPYYTPGEEEEDPDANRKFDQRLEELERQREFQPEPEPNERGNFLASDLIPLAAIFVPAGMKHPNTLRAIQMEKNGLSRERIWQETGSFKGADGIWRREISDNAARLKEDLPRNRLDPDLVNPVQLFDHSKKLKDIIEHPKLYKAEGQIADIEARNTGFNFGIAGAFDDALNRIYLAGGKADSILSTTLHEVQHALQAKYKMNRGGSVNEFLPEGHAKEVAEVTKKLAETRKEIETKIGDYINPYSLEYAIRDLTSGKSREHLTRYYVNEVKAIDIAPIEVEAMRRLLEKRAELSKVETTAYERYKKLGGEVEARAVQARKDMTPEERRATPPWKSFDVPEAEWNVRFEAGKAGEMAVKGKGGNWHPETVGRFATPLGERLTQDIRARLDREVDSAIEYLAAGNTEALSRVEARAVKFQPEFEKYQIWTDSKVRNYLNRYAGTVDDPLRDVEVPFRDGTIPWEKLTDQVIKADEVKGPKGAEQEWRLTDRGPESDYSNTQALQALQSYLSHVGDYLRQNVDPAKLGQYDLVRAVKETAANDARMAKLAEKAAADSTAQLPVYREYPDGYKWVELKLPEKLTKEQEARVRSATEQELKAALIAQDPHMLPYEGRLEGYVALDAQGKPVKNSYTGGIAAGKTPQEAWLAGELSKEGNIMGHCVGGYCEGVAAGESRIFSLRDAKGKSHVTVEVEPGGDIVQGRRNQPRGETRYEQPDNILQIKGKQNRAPAAEYLPYVQDFVRGEKWGEVGDLEGTGLSDWKHLLEGRTKGPRLDAEIQHFERLGKRFINDVEYDSVMREIDRYELTGSENKQRGSADPKLLAGIAATAGGAMLGVGLDSESPLRGGLIGAAGGLAAGGLGGKLSVLKGADIAFGRSSTRLEHIDPTLRRNVRDMEHAASVDMSRASDKIHGFTGLVKKLPKEQVARIEKAYREGDNHAMAEAIKGNPALVAAWREVRGFIDSIGEQLRGFERFGKGITEHMPRVVKDYEGLIKALGGEAKVGLEKLMEKANKRSIRLKGRELTDVERSIILNNFLAKEPGISSQPGFAKRRTVTMTDELAPFYYGMEDSLVRYAHAAVEDVAIARFFGKDLRTTSEGNNKYTNLDESIGALTDRGMREKRFTPEQAVELQGILRARFGPGEHAPAGPIQDVRNVTGMATLGQIGSGLIQSTESLFSIYHHGLRPTLEATGIILTGRGIKPKEFGLANHVIEETIGKRPTGQALSMLLKANLLAPLDQFGIKMNLTASFQKNKRLAQTERGRKVLEEKWGKAYGDAFPDLIKDLQNSTVKNRGFLTESLLYGELSDIRPTSRIEHSQLFNEHPNARFMYQLKQFMLTQADIIRRDASDKIKTGDPKQVAIGLKNLALYSATMALATIPADAIKAWLSGREFDFDKIDYVENMARYFGLSRYTIDKIQGDKPAKGVLDYVESMVKPPVASVIERGVAGMSEPRKLVPFIPIGGRHLYDREFGGNEEHKLRQLKQKRLDDRNKREREFPYLKEQRLRREAARRQKQLEKARSLP